MTLENNWTELFTNLEVGEYFTTLRANQKSLWGTRQRIYKKHPSRKYSILINKNNRSELIVTRVA